MNKSVQITGLIVIGAIVLTLIIVNSAKPSTENTVSVTGTSTVKIMPDLVGIYFSADTTGQTTQEAADKNAQVVDNLTSSLQSAGISKDEIQTESFSIYPEYNYPSNEIKDYRATHQIRVYVPANDSSKIGNVVDLGISAGAGVNYINFELSNNSQSEYKNQAIKAASEDARSKAQSLAEGLGKNLGDLVSANVNDYSYMPWPVFNGEGTTSAEAEKAATSITPSDQDVSASVTAVYKIR